MLIYITKLKCKIRFAVTKDGETARLIEKFLGLKIAIVWLFGM